MNLTEIKSLFLERLGAENIVENADMSNLCSFKAGGRADLLVKAQDMEALRYALFILGRAAEKSCLRQEEKVDCGSACEEGRNNCEKGCGRCCGKNNEQVQYMVMGNGSNILVKDGGYRGVIIKMGEGFSHVRREGNLIIAGPSVLMSALAREAADNSLTGFEFASGIPGSLGGAVFMNAGAYGGEMKDIIKTVRAISKDGTREYIAEKDELSLSYRHSIFSVNGDIVTEVVLELAPGNKKEIYERMKELGAKRNSKQPVNLPSAGSFFKRPEGNFAGALIEEAGLKGLAVGDAQVSPLHGGFIVNNGNALASDIIRLMKLVQNIVMDKTGIYLEPEVRIIGED